MKKILLLFLLAISVSSIGQVPIIAGRYKIGQVTKCSEPSPLYIYSNTTDAITYQWQDLGANTTFEYQYADDAAFTTSLVSGTTASNSLNISGLSSSATKYFRVRSIRTGNFSASDWVTGSGITMPAGTVARYEAAGVGYDIDNSYATMTGTAVDTWKSVVNTSASPLIKGVGASGNFTLDGTVATQTGSVQNLVGMNGGVYADVSTAISLGTGPFTIAIEIYASSIGGSAIFACDAVTGGNRLVRFSNFIDCFVAINNVFSSQMVFPKPWIANTWTKIVIQSNGTTVRASCDGGKTWSNSVTRPGSGAAFNLTRIGASSSGSNSFGAAYKYIYFGNTELNATDLDRVQNYTRQQNPWYNSGVSQSITPTGFPSTLQPAPTNNYHSFVLGGQPSRGHGASTTKTVYSFGNYSVVFGNKSDAAPTYATTYLFGYDHSTHRLTDPINLGRFGVPSDNHFRPTLDLGDNRIWVGQMWRHYSIANGDTYKITRVFGKNYDFSDFQTVPNGNEIPGRDSIGSGWMSKSQYHQVAFVGNTMLDYSQRWNGSSSFGQYINCQKSTDGGNSWETITAINTVATFWVYPMLIYNGNQDEALIIVEQVLSGSPTQAEGLLGIKTSDGIWYSNFAGTYKKNVVKDGPLTITELYANCTIIDARSLTSTAWGHGLCTTNGRVYGIIGNGSNTAWKLYYQDKNGAPVISGNISVSGHTLMTETQVNYLGTYTYPYHRSVATVLYKGGTTWWGVFLETNAGNWKPILCESTDDGVTWTYLRDVGTPENKQHEEMEFSHNYHFNGDVGVLVMAVYDGVDATRMVIIPTNEL